ncbi:hypothetical protein PDE_03097 [Penicillium oxalicum 114-2]|uniref:Uncharacterized protein n=1 Tax=Penicillium oxalicum (strain 114-2 / CGMCC 5302) TaxID=933388 RepID=S7ZHI0_PENO1|nr:hypothetical protein PDE_03097 [Penicillium oxalicum 114-2]
MATEAATSFSGRKVGAPAPFVSGFMQSKIKLITIPKESASRLLVTPTEFTWPGGSTSCCMLRVFRRAIQASTQDRKPQLVIDTEKQVRMTVTEVVTVAKAKRQKTLEMPTKA